MGRKAARSPNHNAGIPVCILKGNIDFCFLVIQSRHNLYRVRKQKSYKLGFGWADFCFLRFWLVGGIGDARKLKSVGREGEARKPKSLSPLHFTFYALRFTPPPQSQSGYGWGGRGVGRTNPAISVPSDNHAEGERR